MTKNLRSLSPVSNPIWTVVWSWIKTYLDEVFVWTKFSETNSEASEEESLEKLREIDVIDRRDSWIEANDVELLDDLR